MMKRLFSAVALFLLTASMFAQDYTPDYKLIDKPEYPTLDLAVATYNILDYGADPTGEKDCTSIIQKLVDKLSGKGTISTERGNYQNITGGILYMPEGTYLMEGQVILPPGVTIRGDWKQPTKTSKATGTIIKARPVISNKDSKSLFILMPCAHVCNLSIWYPEQDINDIKEYAPTFLLNKSGWWGSDYPGIRNITFINSYIGVKYLGGGCPNIYNVFGTPLYYGIQMDGIGDVGRFDWISFAPQYWANSGLPGAPSTAAIATYTRRHTTGIRMMRNDWSYTCNFDAEALKIGFHALPGADGYKPNGHHYNFNLYNCETGVLCEGTSYCGIMFTRINTDARCDVGFRINAGSSGPVQLYECDLKGSVYALGSDDNAAATVNVQDCRIYGTSYILSGQLVANSNVFDGDVEIGNGARTIFTGNTVKGNFNNHSMYKCQVSDAKTPHALIPDYSTTWMQPRETKPAGKTLVWITAPEYGCVPLAMRDDLSTAPDNSAAIQKALDDVAAAGGGIVYMPSGHYRMDHEITIPKGVELKGSSDICASPHGQGAIFEVFCGEGNENGTPLISMAEGSGIRGVCINYPKQNDPNKVKVYPYALRGNKDVYIVNFSVRACYKAVDLFTNKCDNHYLDGMTGHAFKNVITVGGGSQNGIISNVQLNTGGYAYGHETKNGAWKNCLEAKSNNSNYTNDAFSQNKRDLDFLSIQDCEGEILYNNFLFGCNKGMLFEKGANGKAARKVTSLGNAVDGAVNTFVIDAIDDNLDLTNSQVVALDEGSAYPAYFITVGQGCEGKTINFFSSDHWGSGKYFAKVESGIVNLYNASCNQSGSALTFSVATGAKVNVFNAEMKNVKKFLQLSSMASHVSVENTIVDPTGASTSTLAAYNYNLPSAWEMGKSTDLLPRTGWTARAFNDETSGKLAGRAIDDDPASRWSTNVNQAPDQWFMVDFGKPLTFNSILMDTMKSSSDGPKEYYVEVQGEGSDTWTKVAEGSEGSAMLIVSFETLTARKVRITQTGSKNGNYWSIYEFYVGNMNNSSLDVRTGISEVVYDNVVRPSRTGIYDLQGRKLGEKDIWNSLPGGIYIVNGKTTIKK